MATVTKGKTFGTTEEVTAAKLHQLVDSATVTEIVNADINASAAIASSKLADKTGSDTNLVTGTAGTDGNLIKWNADGDAVDSTFGVLDEDDFSSDSATDVPTQQSTKAYVDTSIASSVNDFAIIESAATGARNGSTYYFNDLSETVDADNIVSVTSGEITFASTGTYLIDISGSMIDNDTSSGDAYDLTLTSGTSSTTGLLNQPVRYNQQRYDSISIKYIRTVSDTATDKLALYASPISGADITLWQASDVVIVITKLS